MPESVEVGLARIDETIKGLEKNLLAELRSTKEILAEKITHGDREVQQNVNLLAQRVQTLEREKLSADGERKDIRTRLEPIEDFGSRVKGVLAVFGFLASAGAVSAVVEIVKAFHH